MKKKQVIFALFVFLALVLVSCNPSNVLPDKQEEPGYLRIVFPKENSRSLTNSESASVVNFYKVFLWNNAGEVISKYYYMSDLENDGDIPQITLKPDVYRMIVLACADGTVTIAGTGFTDNIIISRGDVTETSVTLKAVSFELTPPAERVFQNDTFAVSVKANLNNEHLGFFGEQKITAVNYKSTSSQTTTTDVSTKKISNYSSSLDLNVSIQAPSIPQKVNYIYYLSSVFIVDDWLGDGKYYDTNGKLAYVNNGTGEPLYDNMFLFSVDVEDETSGLQMNISWAPDAE